MKYSFLFFLCILPPLLFAQKPSFTANNQVTAYNGTFAFGSNPGYYGGYNNNNTNDKLIHDLFFKANLHTTRPGLYDYFLEQYGPNVRVSEFDYYAKTLGMVENTIFLNGPSNTHRENDSVSCLNSNNGKMEKFRSEMFKNMYLPIWDDSINGKTPINDQNYYAAYVYKVVKTYGKYVRFYEVWNEPDFAANGNVSLSKGQAGNWWDNNPSPCDLVNMRAPFTYYVRMLRITYEVVKSIDPNAYVATGGLGYDNFLDAIMRNTDNPDSGKVTNEYPLKGGAYFDVMSFHSYPQYTLRAWDNTISGFKYFRHSDYAVQKVMDLKNAFKTVITKYGYNGTTFPEKHFILTEVNIPRKIYGTSDLIGSPVAQRNFLMKTYVIAQKQNIKQVYAYTIGDSKDTTDNTASQDGFDVMGYYYNLNKVTPSTAKLAPSGVGVKALSEFIYGYTYNASATTALNLPNTIDGAAFTKGTDTRYVLWAKTTIDKSEIANANFKFPSPANISSIDVKQWDLQGDASYSGSASIPLTASPSMISVVLATGLEEKGNLTEALEIYPNPSKGELNVLLPQTNINRVSIYDLQGNEVSRYLPKSGQIHLSISTLDIASGIYYLHATSALNVIVKKLIVGN